MQIVKHMRPSWTQSFAQNRASQPQRALIAAISAVLLVLPVMLSACGSDGGGEGGEVLPSVPFGEGGTTVDSPQSMSDAIHIEGAMRYSEPLPSPASPSGGSLAISASELVVTQNSSFSFDFTPDIPADRRLDAIVVQIDGARESFVIPVSAQGSSPALPGADHSGAAIELSYVPNTAAPVVGVRLTPSGTINNNTSPFSAPATARAFTSMQSDVPFPDMSSLHQGMRQQPSPAAWTTPVPFQIRAQSVASGDPQVSLTWDGPGDVDLWVTEPDGTRIGFSNRTSIATGGRLDTDNVTGFGPENIAWEVRPPAGAYAVEVHYYSGSGPRGFTVVVTNGGQRTVHTGTLTTVNQRITVTTFNVAGAGPGGSTGEKTGNAIGVVESTGNTDATGAPFSGITVYASTSVGHLSGAFSIYVTVDGVPAAVGPSTISVRASRRPTACTPNRVDYHAVHFAVQPGVRVVEARISGNPTFDWPEVKWRAVVHVGSGECVMVNLGN